MIKSDISNILRSKNTVFTFKDILLASDGERPHLLRRRLHYYIKTGELHAIRRGIYAKDTKYNPFELATKIYTPAYISFETVLGGAGITFQYYSQIFVASYQTKEFVCDGHKFSFRKIKNTILTNKAGIEMKENYAIASPERAMLDVVYLHKEYHFDNMRSIAWEKVFALLPLYANKRMEKTIKKYYDAERGRS